MTLLSSPAVRWRSSVAGWLAFGSSLVPTAQAALVAHFALDEGADDASSTAVASSTGAWTGAISGWYAWTLDTLADVPIGTRAALILRTISSDGPPYVATTYPGLVGGSARTVTAWIRGTLPQPRLATIVSWGRNERAARYTFRVETAAGADEGRLRLEASGQAIIGDTPVLDGRWHHVAVVTPQGGSTHDSVLYVDGIPQGATTVGTAASLNTLVDPLDSREWVHLGNGGWSVGSYGFDGGLDDIRIYDEALPEEQIRELASREESPPVLRRALANQTLVLGDPDAVVDLRAAVTGRAPLTYEWQFNDQVIPDQTGPNLIIQPALPAHAGTYRVTVTNPQGSVTGLAQVRLGTGPVEPTWQTVLVGGSATFTVRMPEVAGYRYRWEHNGANEVGINGPQLVLTHLKPADAGYYRVQVLLGNLAAWSEVVELQVVENLWSAYAATILADAPEAYWRLGEPGGATVAIDLAGSHPARFVRFSGTELGLPGMIADDPSTAAQFVPFRANFVERTQAPELNDPRQFTVEVWVKPAVADAFALATALFNLPSAGYQVSIIPSGRLRFRTGASLDPSMLRFDDLLGGQVILEDWNHVVATYDGTTKRLYLNGALVGEQSVPVLASPALNFRLGAGNGPAVSPGSVLNGVLDEAAFYRKALPPSRILTHYIMAGRPQPGALVFSRSGPDLTLVWTDPVARLESASLPHGPWVPVTGAVSPHRVVTKETREWFRLRPPE